MPLTESGIGTRSHYLALNRSGPNPDHDVWVMRLLDELKDQALSLAEQFNRWAAGMEESLEKLEKLLQDL